MQMQDRHTLPTSTEVTFCRVGADSSWTLLETYLECSVDSVVHCQEKFLAIDCTGDISICSNIATGGCGTPTATPMPSLSPPEELCNRSYLESNEVSCTLSEPCFGGTSVSRFKSNSVCFSEPLYGDQYDWEHSMEIADIATGTSEVKSFHPIESAKFRGSRLDSAKSLEGTRCVNLICVKVYILGHGVRICLFH
ncbi:hypothetical protein BAE44_0002965 [Dichanthelium oligosanthes]|uniref:Uncharacterized protein n=1 Tax=Dichanthelium oligosanthes TaxID=888268 RepID=A0A1E5WF35_9POAL|nr:hypothetical protein BAE44_0002965 [Dichanthelium oligosanthes]